MNTAKLVVASLMVALGQDPSIAIITSANALENNFAGVVPPPEFGMDPDVADALWDTSVALKGAAVDMGVDFYEHPDEYVEEAVIALTPYGDITRRLYLDETVSNYDLAVETGCLLLGMQPVKAGGRVILKSVKKFGMQFGKHLEEAKHLRGASANKNATS